MELSSNSLSISISKKLADEEMSMRRATMEDAASRSTGGIRPEAITNEEINKGDPILNTYKVISDAIHGGMGSVWRVHHGGWNVDLAMKRPQPRFFAEGSDSRKEEFVAECENWINLGLHSGIVSCYYVREIGGVPSIFSEWMDGGSLKDRIRDGSLYEGTEQEVRERILGIAIQTARGLKYSHEQGLIHQDIKPGNILLSKDWDAKVADFGLAKAQSRLRDDRKRQRIQDGGSGDAVHAPTTRRRAKRKLQASISSTLGDRNDLMFAVVTAKSSDAAIVVTTVFSAVIGNHSIAPITTWQNQISGRDLMNSLKNPIFFICTSSGSDYSEFTRLLLINNNTEQKE